MARTRTTSSNFTGTSEYNAITKSYFPTRIAVELAVSARLFPLTDPRDRPEGRRKNAELKKAERLKWFQELSMHGDFDSALVAYYEVELSEKQKKVLEVVHALTATQARGHMTNEIFRKLRNGCESRDMKMLGELLIALQAQEEDGKSIASGIETLVINAVKK